MKTQKKKAKQSSLQLQLRLRGYALAHLGEVARAITKTQDELLREQIHPHRYGPITPEYKTHMENQTIEKCNYIVKALQDLRKLKCSKK